ncbi:MAG: glycosyltransferase family 2 protein [Solobacterium sp.]|nr:glycosyltransferase family 2 protein [Solobacterium sp.]
MKDNEMISVIIPVYNVEDYIDECMESVVHQTYKDLEILLINDGSTDGSHEKCLSWAERDTRIRYINKQNEGVAASRNLGVDLAQGKYVSFVDPDDWLDLTYFEKLHQCLTENDADYAECDLWRYNNRTGKKIYRSCYGRMGVPYTLEEHMKYGPTATYKAISRRSLWTEHQIHMPSCSFESPAVYSLILALSKKIANVREPLYYYRRFRENSLIENGYALPEGKPNNTLAIDAMKFLVGEFKRCGIYERYSSILEGVVKYRLSDILAMQFHRKPRNDYLELTKNYREFLSSCFPEGHNERYLCWGGYNLNRILTHMNTLHDPYCRFNFSSLISLLNSEDLNLPVKHKNNYRRIMVERELHREFFHVLEEVQPEYIFLDLIEERFDIGLYEGKYITCSDAWGGMEEPVQPQEIIPFGSEQRDQLFRQAFQLFRDTVKQTVSDTRIIVIENYLSEYVGDFQEKTQFPQIEQIYYTNTILKKYYNHIREKYPEITFVSPSKMPEYFTDKNYEYGAVPSHLNEIVNQKIAGEIEKIR